MATERPSVLARPSFTDGAPLAFLFVALVGSAGFFAVPRQNLGTVGPAFWWLGFWAPFAFSLFWWRATWVRADEHTIAWGRLGRPGGKAPYSAVTDFGWESGQKLVFGRIDLASGVRLRFASDWKHRKALEALVAERAVEAHTQTWGTIGLREVDPWPQERGYAPDRDEIGVASVVGISGLALLGLVASIVAPPLSRAQSVLDLVLPLCFVLLVAAILCVPVAVLGPRWAEFASRRKERWTFDWDGFAWDGPNGRITGRWKDVVDLRSGMSGRLVATLPRFDIRLADGRTASFTGALRDYRKLAALALLRTDRSGWEPLAGDAESDGVTQFGETMRFRYRTRTTRAGLAFATALVAEPAARTVLLRVLGLDLPPMDPRAESVFGGLGVLLAWGWLCWGISRVETDASGISQIGVFGSRRIPWTEVRSVDPVRASELRILRVRGVRTTLWFWSGIGGVERLAEEIERRSVPTD